VNWHLLSNLYTAPNMKFGEAPKTEKVHIILFSFHQPLFSLASNPEPRQTPVLLR
jgi:hypothetical protein